MTVLSVPSSGKEYFQSHVSLFCKCGWNIELFNGTMGSCKNKTCSEYGVIYEISVMMEKVKENGVKH